MRCRAAAEPVDQSRASSTQTRKALVACMRELRKSPDFHDRGRALIEDIIRAGPDKALEVVGVEGAP